MKLAIVGAAQIVSQYHIHALKALSSVEITAVIDLKLSRAQEVASICGAAFSDDLRDAEGATVVLIATPPTPREHILKNLPESVEYVIIEKPAGLTIQDISRIQEISMKRGIRVAVAQTRRYFPNLRLCADLLDSGFLGEIEKITMSEGAIMNWYSNSNHLATATNSSDKGVLQDVGSHLFDWLGILLNRLEISAQDFELDMCKADFSELTNSIKVDFSGPFAVEVRLSRRKLLSNTVRVHGSKGELITRSLLDDCVRFKKTDADAWSVVRTQFDKSEFALEAAFISMWESLLSEKQQNTDFPDLKSIYPGFEFIQQTINHLNK